MQLGLTPAGRLSRFWPCSESACRSSRSSRSSRCSCSAPTGSPTWPARPARWSRKARQFANAARDELRDELGPEYADLELRDLDPRTIVRKHIIEAMNDDERRAPARARGLRPLEDGEMPPYDVDAT